MAPKPSTPDAWEQLIGICSAKKLLSYLDCRNIASMTWKVAVVTLIASICCAARCQTGYVLQSGYPSGGVWSEEEQVSPYNSDNGNDVYQSGAYHGTAGGAGWDGSCSGQQTWEWVWEGAGPPPASVIVTINTSASWSAQKTGGGGSCNDGYGDPVTPVGTPKTIGGATTGVHYLIYNNPGLTFSLQPTASATLGTCSVSTSMAVTSVVMNLAGTLDGSGGTAQPDECLIGQHVRGSVSAGAFSLSNYQWSVSSSGTYASAVDWGSGSVPQSHGWVFPSGQAAWQGSTMQLFWLTSDGGNGTTWSCTATATVPGGIVVGQVSAGYQIDVQAAVGTVLGVQGGPAQFKASNVSPYQVATGNTDSPTTAGIYFELLGLSQPAVFTSVEGQSSDFLAQLFNDCTIEYYTTGSESFSTSGQFVLDSVYPYPSNPSVATMGYYTDDTPSYPLLENAYGIGIDCLYRMMLITAPPNVFPSLPPESVPLGDQEWSWISVCSTTNPPANNPWTAPSDVSIGVQNDYDYSDFVWASTFQR